MALPFFVGAIREMRLKMIANPQRAIETANTQKKLAEILNEVLKQWYPESTVDGWIQWASRYKTFEVAKKCAVRMYQQLLEKGD